MTKAHSSSPSAPSKPAKPYPEFPLFPHATRRWAKKIRGKLHYFGKWEDPDGALQRYLDQKDALHAGLTPADTSERLTVFLLCAKFLTTKKHLLETGELAPRSFDDYAATCKRLIKSFGKGRLVADLRPGDFEKLRAKMAKTWGPVRLGNEMNRVRIVFNYASKSALLEKPIVYGEGFRRPSKKTLRKHRQARGAKMFEAEELRRILDAAQQPLRAMILLGVNCGFGNSDVGTLPLTALDLQRGWLTYARPKTGIERRCPLWPETVAALEEWLALRPAAKKPEHAALVFLTARGDSWAKETMDNPVSKETRKLLDKLGMNEHRNFYCLRHTLQTIGDESRDFIAVRSIMGHASSDIADTYRERMTPERLRAVTDHVRAWLWPKPEVQSKASGRGE
jgi:integrase